MAFGLDRQGLPECLLIGLESLLLSALFSHCSRLVLARAVGFILRAARAFPPVVSASARLCSGAVLASLT